MLSGGSSNIFDEASKKHDKKKKKGVSPHPQTTPTPPLQQPLIKPAPPILPAVRNPEVIAMLDKIHNMDQDLQQKMDKICELTGKSRKEIAQLLENPQNFNPEQWKMMQRQKEFVEEKIYNVIGIEQKAKKVLKQKKQMAKERQGKTLGTRKGWIDMH